MNTTPTTSPQNNNSCLEGTANRTIVGTNQNITRYYYSTDLKHPASSISISRMILLFPVTSTTCVFFSLVVAWTRSSVVHQISDGMACCTVTHGVLRKRSEVYHHPSTGGNRWWYETPNRTAHVPSLVQSCLWRDTTEPRINPRLLSR